VMSRHRRWMHAGGVSGGGWGTENRCGDHDR
jgi:hypothetical protein